MPSKCGRVTFTAARNEQDRSGSFNSIEQVVDGAACISSSGIQKLRYKKQVNYQFHTEIRCGRSCRRRSSDRLDSLGTCCCLGTDCKGIDGSRTGRQPIPSDKCSAARRPCCRFRRSGIAILRNWLDGQGIRPRPSLGRRLWTCPAVGHRSVLASEIGKQFAIIDFDFF